MKPNRPLQNWTPYPNNILDNLDQFTGNEFKILSLMIRKNLGYDNPNMQFSLSYVCLKTGLSKPTTIKAIDSLLEKNTIKVSGNDKRGTRLFDVIWNTPVKKLDQSNNFTSSGKESLPDPVKNIDPLKDNRLKDNKVEESAPDERSEAKELAVEWYSEYSSRTARMIGPSEKDIQEAWKLLQQTDLNTARDAILRYFNCDEWFVKNKKTGKVSYSFKGFCTHFTEIPVKQSSGMKTEPPKYGTITGAKNEE